MPEIKSLQQLARDATAAFNVVSIDHGKQLRRILVGVLLAAGGALQFVVTNQPDIVALLPGRKWLGGAMLAAGLGLRLVQQISDYLNIRPANNSPAPGAPQ